MSILVDPEIQVTTYWTVECLTLLADPTWLTALGTIGATIVALWFGCRRGRIKLKVRTTFNHDLSINVENSCERLVTITQVTWRVDRGNRQWVRCPVQFGDYPEEHSPIKLEPGGAAFLHVFLVAQGEPRWLRTFATDLDISASKQVKALRLKIHTAGPYTKKVAPPKDFLKKLEEVVNLKAGGNQDNGGIQTKTPPGE